ncbi:8912_t:CDS:1, partial [Paraglomus occultum]
GDFEIICMDEFIDNLLREERVFDTILPRLSKRHVLEENDELPPRISALEDDLEDDLSE